MIELKNFLLTYTLLLSPFKLSGFKNIALNCFFNASSQLIFANSYIHHLHFHLYKKAHFLPKEAITQPAYYSANAFINLLPMYYTGNTVLQSRTIKPNKDFKYFLKTLYNYKHIEYGKEGDVIDSLGIYLDTFSTLISKKLTRNFTNYSILPFNIFRKQKLYKETLKVSGGNINKFYLDDKLIKAIEKRGKFTFGMFLDKFKNFIHFEKNLFLFIGDKLLNYITKEFLDKLFYFEVEVNNWNAEKVKVGLSLQAFDKSAGDLRTFNAIHYWAYLFKNNKWYVGNDSNLSEVKDIKKEISNYRHNLFLFNIDYIKRIKEL